ncbi:unnamed protein product [Brassicogethes aeneus]|uniref:Peptidase A2 domain-containing protein n=1 Tax=Brassicogethes aeneus TaxID=1431903 RepID=A0A9P0FGC6_BRAAE|nr:unnamed protein product [Brassicogethes aeneus]
MANAGHVKLPPDFDLQGQNAANEWKFWKVSFEDYLVAVGHSEATDVIKLSVLRIIIANDSARIMTTFAVLIEQQGKYKYMIETIDKYVNPRVNECFERYNFFKRIQKEGESFEHFLTDCRYLVKSCNYNGNDSNETAEDKALRDKIVMEIKDPTTREALLRKDQLTLEKAKALCRTSEQSKSQNQLFMNSEKINVVKRNKYRESSKPRREVKKEKMGPGETFRCRRCQRTHGPRECPAYGRKCKKCGTENHFAVACKVKNIKNIEKELDCSSDMSDIFIGNVHDYNKNMCKYNMFEEILEIEGNKVKTRLDTGADVNIINTFEVI